MGMCAYASVCMCKRERTGKREEEKRTSGILSRCSRSALTLPTIRQMPTTTAPMTAVFCFQFAGCAYQPPAGDHTCLGYLFQLAKEVHIWLANGDSRLCLCCLDPVGGEAGWIGRSNVRDLAATAAEQLSRSHGCVWSSGVGEWGFVVLRGGPVVSSSEVKSQRTVQPGSVAGAGAGSGEKRRKQIGEALLLASTLPRY